MWTLCACTAVLCTAPLTAAAEDVPASPSPPSYTVELPDDGRLSVTVELPGTPALPDEGRAPDADGEPEQPERAREERHFGRAAEGKQPPAPDPSRREAAADSGPRDREAGAREHRSSQSSAKILPVLTLGAGLASIGLGLGFLAIRLRRR